MSKSFNGRRAHADPQKPLNHSHQVKKTDPQRLNIIPPRQGKDMKGSKSLSSLNNNHVRYQLNHH